MTKVERTRGVMTRKRAADRLDAIRRGNVKRHADAAARQKHAADRQQQQRNATMQRELDMLHESSLRGSGLDRVRIDRMAALRAIISK